MIGPAGIELDFYSSGVEGVGTRESLPAFCRHRGAREADEQPISAASPA
jgi:hypothetical protein